MHAHRFSIHDYCTQFIAALQSRLGDNVLYVGLQGSHLRGEATESSDIDMMVILHTLTPAVMDDYRAVIDQTGHSDRACGFICRSSDMQHWNPLEICQLKHTTKDLYGKLDDFLPAWTMEDEINYIKVSLNNLYHALCHGYIHGSRDHLSTRLLSCYKSAFFILQNIHFVESFRADAPHAQFILSKADLLPRLHGEDKAVLEALLHLSGGGSVDFNRHFDLLLRWCQHQMTRIA